MNSVITLVVGLGNPGKEYENTRHNAGFRAIDALASRVGAGKFKRAYRGKCAKTPRAGPCPELTLLKPLTFMNRSGFSVARAAADLALGPTNIIVVHDDLDITPGRVKIKSGGGMGGHNGLESVRDSLRSPDFIRVRIGIGKTGENATDYVLGRFRADEEVILVNDALPKAVDAILAIVKDGPQAAMNEFNKRLNYEDEEKGGIKRWS